MAWHSGKPADTDLLSQSVQHIRENFTELEPLQPHVAKLVDLTALHPYIDALLSSRIVDHNLDVANPPNGWYARHEDGRQKVWVAGSLVYFTTRTLNVVGTMPAAFARVMGFGGSWINGSGFVGAVRREEIGPLYMHAVTNTGYQLRVIRMDGGTNSFNPGDELPFLASFEGMWK